MQETGRRQAQSGVRHRFRAMGVEVELVSAAAAEAARPAFAAVEREFARLNAIFSRFDPGSELSRLNRDGHAEASEELLELAATALRSRSRTGGLVDVTVHDALVAWGYDRTFSEVVGRDVPPPATRPACGGPVAVDLAAGTIELGPATKLDFGGPAKGYAVDVGLRRLARLGPAVVAAGGDLAVAAGGETPWPVAIDTPGGGVTVALAGGALSTSSRDARRWRAGGRDVHHLIDPRTGAPSASDVVRATAWAPTATEAEVRAKTLFLLGVEAAEDYARLEGIPAVLVTAAGEALVAGGLPRAVLGAERLAAA